MSRKKPSKQRKAIPATPFSEDESKYRDDYSPDDCIDELKAMVEAHPEKVITRNFFRVHSTISESTWTRYFGTFLEFKRQAGIVPTRQHHALERQIAKQVSVDNYRKVSSDRTSWGDKYIRESHSAYKTIICASDLHDIECDPFYLQVLIDTCKRVQPDIISLVGDVFDLPEFGRYTVDPRDWDVTGRIKFAHENILAPIRESCPNAQIDLIEGNHEFRLLRHLSDATPALKAVLADLHGFTIQKLFGLDTYEINYIAQGDLGAYTKNDVKGELAHNYKIYYDAFLAHHFPMGKTYGLPGVNGHEHKQHMWSFFDAIRGSYNWLQMGCGHVRKASFCNGQIWQNGFAIVHVNSVTHSVILEPVLITDFACVGGKYYQRNAS